MLLIFSDGLIALWDIKESKSIFITGGNSMLSPYQEAKKVTSACWACPLGSKVALGYSNGDVLIWAILHGHNPKAESLSENSNRTSPLFKLNLGYKLDKIPIVSLRCNYVDAKASRLYVMGASSNSLQVLQFMMQTVPSISICQWSILFYQSIFFSNYWNIILLFNRCQTFPDHLRGYLGFITFYNKVKLNLTFLCWLY